MRIESGSIVRTSSVGIAGSMLLALWLGFAGGVRAQDATPAAGGSRTISCAVDLMGSGSAGDAAATPDSAPAVASPAAEMVATPAGSEASGGMTRTVRTIAECLSGGDFAGAAALMTDNFILNVIGAASAEEIETALAGAERLRIRLLLTPETYDDGTASVVVVYEGFVNTTGSVVAERWYFVVVDGVYKVDRVEPAELPPGIS
jgi:hypothetical protein